MHRLLIALLLALLFAVPATAQTWKRSTWPDQGFAAEFPAKPSLDTASMEDRPSATVGASMEKGYFAVVVAAMPEFTAEMLADSARRERILDGAQEQSIADGGTTLRSQRSFTLRGRAGREFISTMADDGGEVHTRLYLEEQRMYIQIAVIADGTLIPLATRFLESFEFL